MASTRNEHGSNNNDNINSNVRLLGDSDQGLSRTHAVADVLGSQHLSHQQPPAASDFSSGEGNTSIDFLAGRTAPQHQQQSQAHHHSIPSIPEDRTATATAFGKHPATDNQEGCSPDPHSSATTTGTTSTPTSVGNSSSPTPCESAAKAAVPPPDFHQESLRATPRNVIHGQSHWPAPLGEGVIGPRYGPVAPSAVDTADVSQYNISPTEAGRYSSSSFPCAIKLLVSNNVAGSIIGRAGQTISELQAQSSTRIKLSQTGDYYPGSQDRVCLVQGQLENVKGALSLLLERLYMLQEHQHSQHMAWQSNRSDGVAPFDFVVRILVPSSSCGMIIGKSGTNIRQMEEASGVSSVRLSPKDIVDPNYPSATITAATSERVVTLTGQNLESCLKCLFIILDGMTTHPDICRYTNMTTSYSRIMPDPLTFVGGQGGVRTGPPLDPIPGPEGNQWGPHFAQTQLSGLGKRVSSSPDLSGPFLAHRAPMPLEPRPGPVDPHQGRENIPYSPMFGGPASTYSPLRTQSAPRMPQTAGPQIYLNPHVDGQSATAPVPNSVSAPDLLALQLESMHLPSSPQQPHPPPPPAPAHQDYPLFPSQLPGGPVAQAQIMVPDNMIGSILGRGGRTLNELQVQSGTRIRISQRGEYLPGTRNRIVTIRGPNDHSVSLAQYLMSQRMILPRTATYQVPLGQAPPPIPTSYSEDQGPVSDHHLFHHHHQSHLADSQPQPPFPPHPHSQQFPPHSHASSSPPSSHQGPGTIVQSMVSTQPPPNSTATDHSSAT